MFPFKNSWFWIFISNFIVIKTIIIIHYFFQNALLITEKSNSSLESAINYIKKCWNDLFTFMGIGFVKLTNNSCKCVVKPFVIQRKVFQTQVLILVLDILLNYFLLFKHVELTTLMWENI